MGMFTVFGLVVSLLISLFFVWKMGVFLVNLFKSGENPLGVVVLASSSVLFLLLGVGLVTVSLY